MEIVENIPGIPKPISPYSVATKGAGLIFCSGQVGLVPESGILVEGGFEAQAHQVLKNLTGVLQAGGSSFDKVLMTTIFLASMDDFKTLNGIYATYINSTKPPARQTVAVKELPLGALIEISLIAEA